MPFMIAVIDDDEAVRDSTQAVLESYGYNVRAYEDALHFLRHQDEAHDCLIVDHNMPGMTGLELIAKLRQEPEPKPVLLITGQGTPAIAAAAQALGVPCLAKPVLDDELIAHLSAAGAGPEG